MIHSAVEIVTVPRVEVAQRQIMLRCIMESVSCDSSTRCYVVTDIKATTLQCTVPQVLSVAPEFLVLGIDPTFFLVDVGKHVGAPNVSCVDVVKYSQQTSKCFEFFCTIRVTCMNDTLEQAVPSKVVDFGSIGSCIYHPVQCIWI